MLIRYGPGFSQNQILPVDGQFKIKTHVHVLIYYYLIRNVQIEDREERNIIGILDLNFIIK